MLVSGDAQDLRVTARWGDYTPLEKDGKPTGEWQRHEREETVPIRLSGNRANPSPAPVTYSDGLEIITSVRRVRLLESLPGLPEGVRAVSVFLVNRRAAEDRTDLKDARFAFQASLAIETDRPLVPRPDPLAEASAGTLRALADALRSGQLGPSITRMTLSRVAHCPDSIATELCRLAAEGLAPTHMALLLEIAADAAEQRLSGSVQASPVWTGRSLRSLRVGTLLSSSRSSLLTLSATSCMDWCSPSRFAVYLASEGPDTCTVGRKLTLG